MITYPAFYYHNDNNQIFTAPTGNTGGKSLLSLKHKQAKVLAVLLNFERLL